MTADLGGLITGREAAWELAQVGLSRRQALRVLASGLGGQPQRTPGCLLYDRERVRDLARRPEPTIEQLQGMFPGGLFVARRDVDAMATGPEQREALAGGWPFAVWTSVLLRARIEAHGSVPLIATVAGFVVAGAQIAGVGAGPAGYSLELAAPDAWFEELRRCRVPTGPGRSWVIWGWQPYRSAAPAGGRR